ncbi:MAG: hypothetical protein ABEH86_04490 [Haloarcula sp.]
MKLTTLAGALLAVLVITGSAAALPGAAVAQADDHADNAQTAEHESDQAADRRGPPAEAGDETDRRGPPASLPEQVPDFVGDIHSLVNQKLAGDLTGGLGAQISDLTPGEEHDAAAENVDNDAAAENADTGSESSQ